MKTRAIAITNNKGGIGKTTTCTNLAAGLAIAGRSVLVVDTDPQANATYALCGPGEDFPTLYEVLITRSSTLPQIVRPTHSTGVSLVPSRIELSAADIALAATTGREWLLARSLSRLPNHYDYVLFDTPPSLGLLTVNAIAASSEILIPVGVGTFSLLGVKILEDTITQLKENLRLPALSILGAVPTLYDRTRAAKQTVEALHRYFGPQCFATIIPKSKYIEEAHSRAVSIFAYAPTSAGGLAYQALVQEVLAREEQ